MTSAGSITAQKQSFLTTQIRRLGAPLAVPSTVTTIPGPTLDKILDATNKKITAHNRRSFGIESQSNVVEQIDSLYWSDMLSGGLPSRKAETCVKREIDLTDSKNGIRSIPPSWEEVALDHTGRAHKRRRADEQDEQMSDDENALVGDGEEGGNADDAAYYDRLYVTLCVKVERRDELRLKIDELKKLQALLKPFNDPKVHIQPNLLTKDNTELESELSKMRILMAKVGNGLQRQQLQTGFEDQGVPDRVVQSEKDKLNILLNL